MGKYSRRGASLLLSKGTWGEYTRADLASLTAGTRALIVALTETANRYNLRIERTRQSDGLWWRMDLRNERQLRFRIVEPTPQFLADLLREHRPLMWTDVVESQVVDRHFEPSVIAIRVPQVRWDRHLEMWLGPLRVGPRGVAHHEPRVGALELLVQALLHQRTGTVLHHR